MEVTFASQLLGRDDSRKNGFKGPRDPESEIELSLFNLREDPQESVNVIRLNPEVSEKLQSYASKYLEKWPLAKRAIKK